MKKKDVAIVNLLLVIRVAPETDHLERSTLKAAAFLKAIDVEIKVQNTWNQCKR